MRVTDADHRGLEAVGAHAFSEITEKSFLEENARVTRAERVSALLPSLIIVVTWLFGSCFSFRVYTASTLVIC